jgi:SAM-dependent MidA family methyltransferase
VTSGNADLIALIRAEIDQTGPISFARFMEHALYHPENGFYASGRARLGREGDFFTSVSVGSAFGQLLARQFFEVWQKLGQPKDFFIVEQGAHHGEFAGDVLECIAAEEKEFFEAVTYRIVEPSAVLRDRQKALAQFTAKMEWFSSLEALPAFQGVFFANELLDAFPVRLVSRRPEAPGAQTWSWLERRVGWSDRGLVFDECPIGDPILRERADRLPELEGPFEAEISLETVPWIRAVSARLLRGLVLAIDYGFSTADRYISERREGTLRVRRRHRLLESPFEAVGEADITSHVDWDSLVEQAAECGLQLAGRADQHHFLTGILAAYPDLMEKAPPKFRREVQTLLHPEMLGRSFQVLAFQGGISAPLELAGFRFAAKERF